MNVFMLRFSVTQEFPKSGHLKVNRCLRYLKLQNYLVLVTNPNSVTLKTSCFRLRVFQ